MTVQCSWPPFCVRTFTICCCPVLCKACTNLLHWSSDTSRSSKASFRLYTERSSERSSVYCLRVSTFSLRSWFNNPKSGSITFARSDFSLLMLAKMLATSSNSITYNNNSAYNTMQNVYIGPHLTTGTAECLTIIITSRHAHWNERRSELRQSTIKIHDWQPGRSYGQLHIHWQHMVFWRIQPVIHKTTHWKHLFHHKW